MLKTQIQNAKGKPEGVMVSEDSGYRWLNCLDSSMRLLSNIFDCGKWLKVEAS